MQMNRKIGKCGILIQWENITQQLKKLYIQICMYVLTWIDFKNNLSIKKEVA